MSWKDLFIKPAEKKEQEEKLTPIKENAAQVSQNFSQPQNFTGGIDQSLIAKMDTIFEQSNQPGPDLYEFISSIKKMEGKPIDEKTKFETVFDAMSTMGLTKQRLIESGQYYMGVFSEVKQEFEKEYNSTLQNTVTNLNAQAESVMQENGALQKQIEELNKKISENLTKSQQLRTEAATNESRLMQSKISFESTHNTFVNGVQKYVDGVNAYLK